MEKYNFNVGVDALIDPMKFKIIILQVEGSTRASTPTLIINALKIVKAHKKQQNTPSIGGNNPHLLGV